MILCRDCILALRSRGEKIMVSDSPIWEYDSQDPDNTMRCEWCEDEENEELYEVMWMKVR